MKSDAEIVNAVLKGDKELYAELVRRDYAPTVVGEAGDIQIENETDFNTYVLGAMAELSENGRAPEGITYENILRLAQSIREETIK